MGFLANVKNNIGNAANTVGQFVVNSQKANLNILSSIVGKQVFKPEQMKGAGSKLAIATTKSYKNFITPVSKVALNVVTGGTSGKVIGAATMITNIATKNLVKPKSEGKPNISVLSSPVSKSYDGSGITGGLVIGQKPPIKLEQKYQNRSFFEWLFNW